MNFSGDIDPTEETQMVDATGDGRLNSDVQILVRDLVEKQLSIYTRRLVAFGSLMSIVVAAMAAYFLIDLRGQSVVSAERAFEQAIEQNLRNVTRRMDELQTDHERINLAHESELSKLIGETDLRLAETRKALTDAQVELDRWQRSAAETIGETRVRMEDGKVLAAEAREALDHAASLAELAKKEAEEVRNQIASLSQIAAASGESSLSMTDVAQVAEKLAATTPFQAAVSEKIRVGITTRLDLHGNIRIFGSLEVRNPVDTGTSTLVRAGGLKFVGSEGAFVDATSVRIIGQAGHAGDLRILDGEGLDAVRITHTSAATDYPAAGMMLLRGGSSQPASRGGIYLGRDNQFHFSSSGPTEQNWPNEQAANTESRLPNKRS